MKECPSCNASVPDSADVCPSCSLTFGEDDDGDARKTMLGMSFAAKREGAGDASSTADGAPTAGAEDEETDDAETDASAEELLFNLDFRRSRESKGPSGGDASDEDAEPLRVPDDASPTGTLRGTGSEATDASDESETADQQDISANPATRTHEGLPEFEPGRVFGGRRNHEDVPQGEGDGDDGDGGEGADEPSRRVEARDLDSVRDAFRKRRGDASPDSGDEPDSRDAGDDESAQEQGPRPEDFSETPRSGILKVPGKEKSKPGHASEESGSGIIKRPEASSESLDEDSDVIGDNTYMDDADEAPEQPSEAVSDVRQTAQVADPDHAVGGWNRPDETAQIEPETHDEPGQDAPDESLTGETDVIAEGPQRGAANWVALVAGLLWVIAADQIWVTASFDATAVQVKFTAAMVGSLWSLFGPFIVAKERLSYIHVILGAVAGSTFAATLAVTGLALGDIAGLLGAVVLIVAGVLEH